MSPTKGLKQPAEGARRVLVIGGGIAGLTAAWRLAKSGYHVTVLEKKEMFGGNLGSRSEKGATLDVYPHMYQAWYGNFWALVEDAGIEKGEPSFRAFSRVYQAQKRENGEMQLSHLTRPYSASHLLENLFSGVAPPADMFLFGYASLDLMAEKRNPTLMLENVSLTGYLSSRAYMTRTALEAYEAFVLRVWGLPAYMISAADCQAYAAYCYAAADEDGYLCTGSAQEVVIDPIVEQLRKAGHDIRENCEVTGVALDELPKKDDLHRVVAVEYEQKDAGHEAETGARKVVKIAFTVEVPPQPEGAQGEAQKTLTGSDFDAVVLAVPPAALSALVRREQPGGRTRIIDALPELAGLNRVGSQSIPVLNLYFNRRLDGVPEDPVALNGSALSLAFTDISQNWPRLGQEVKGKTVLALSCSEPALLVGPKAETDDPFAMIEELSRYLKFDPGAGWDEGGEIEWSRCAYNTNIDAQLSLNSVGSDDWRPAAAYPDRIANLAFAGDYCKHDFGITTIEGAAATGVKAAQAVRTMLHEFGDEIELAPVELLPPEMFVGMRYAWLTTALAAMGWSRLTDATAASKLGEPAEKPDPLEELATKSSLRYLITPGLPARPPR